MNTNNYKTVKCKNFDQFGQCKYGNSCTFAHGENEMRKSPDYTNQGSTGGYIAGFAGQMIPGS